MKVLHLTDLHLPPVGETLWGLDAYGRLERVLTDMAEGHPDAAFCVVSGDLTDKGDPDAYTWLAERLDAMPFDCIPMIGNHDDRAALLAGMPTAPRDRSGFVQGVRETGAGVFLFLDTFKGGTSAGQYCPARQDWLRAQLEAAGDRPIWIFMHHPPFDIGVDYMDRIKLDEAEEFAALVRERHIRHLFFGHVHRPVFVTWQGIPCNALPGTNHQVPLDRGRLGTSYSVEPAMYGVILLGEDQATVHLDACLDRDRPDMDW